MTRSFIAVLIFASAAFGQTTSLRIRCGGPAYTDSKGNAWAADKYFTGGTTYGTATFISNTPDQPLYQDERYGTGVVYNMPMPDGTYTVNLKFSENFFTGAGMRKFDVKLNGTVVEPGFDIFAAAGAGTKAVDKSYTVTAAGGTGIKLAFNAIVDNPKIDAIEVLQLAPAPTMPNFADAEVPSGTIDGTNAVFNLTHVPQGQSLQLIRNGLVLKSGLDYTLSGGTITFTATAPQGDLGFSAGVPQPGDLLQAWYRY